MSYMFKFAFGNGEVEEFDGIFDSKEKATEVASCAAACQREDLGSSTCPTWAIIPTMT